MVALLLGAGIAVAGLAGAAANPDSAGNLSRFEFVETHMGCAYKIVLYSKDDASARSASRAGFDRIAVLDNILSDYQAESELSLLGQKAGGPPVPVSADLFDVLRISKQFHEKTGGALDVTIAPVGRLWRRARRDRKLPDPQRLAEARALVDANKLVLDPERRTVQLAMPGMRLDVGGIAKGYASQAAIDVLRGLGITRALVGGAGDIVVGDPPPDARGWTIGIASPESSRSPETYVLLSNAAISTSGDSERFVVIDGHRYSHIIDPTTGKAVEERASVTVVAPDGATADALETSVYIMGPQRGLELVEKLPGVAALYARSTPTGVVTFESSRFKKIPRTGPKRSPGATVK
jgi:thiamine biosynthesis lipoprotein